MTKHRKNSSMDKLRAAIESHDDDFSCAVLADDCGFERAHVSGLIHTLICNREIFYRKKVDNIPQYNKNPLPQW